MIARLQMSDLHLGDPRSLLSNPEVAAAAARQVAALGGGSIGRLILAGDVWEECVPGDMTKTCEGLALSVHQASSVFFGELFRQVEVESIVYVPGNHDLSAWSWYAQSKGSSTVTSYEGREVPAGDWPWKILLPGFSGKLTVSYPIYRDLDVGPDYPMLVITHGHLLDPLVLGWDSASAYELLRTIGCPRTSVPIESELAGSANRLASATLPFVLSLWKRYSQLDYAYSNYVMRRLEHPQSCTWQSTFPKDGSYPMDECMLAADAPPAGQGYANNLGWLLEVLIMDPDLPTPVGSLRQNNDHPAFARPSCLTFGHDHLGTCETVVACGVPFVCADSGGWTSEWDGHLPHTHVLAWDSLASVVPRPYFIRVRTPGGSLL